MNKTTPLLIMFFALAMACYAQNDSLIINKNIKALENYAANKPIEKVHLHLDRQLYFPGDTIWFKAYVVLGEYHKLSALSGILYVELINPKDSLVKRVTLKLQAGTAPGDFELLYNIDPGTYRIRAYTNWMRNAGPEYFYDQAITVASFSTAFATPLSKAGTPSVGRQTQTADKIDLQFFPEGGDLVNGLRSKVAFKAINQNGMAEDVQGSITDSTGNEVATFSSQHLGMGTFPLEPQKGKQYFAKVTAADGSRFNVPLPSAKETGFTLAVNNNLADSLYIKVAAVNVPDTVFYLIAQVDGREYFAAAHKLQNSIYTASVAKNRFPTGIVQFTLFGQSGEPLNERIVFIQNDDQLKLSLTPDKQTYAPGEQVNFTLQATEPDGTPAAGTFSVSVIDESKMPVDEAAENTIFTDLLLKSEISGHVQDPNYYFTSPNDKTKADLDLLMLTQGYRRFEWKQILRDSSNTTAVFQPEKGFSLSGNITTPAGKLVPNGKVILTSIKNMLVLDTLTDANGRFMFRDLMLPDTAKVVVNAKKANGGNNVMLSIDKPSYPPVTAMISQPAGYITDEFTINTKQTQQAYSAWRQDSLGHVIQLKEVKIKDHKIPPYHPDYSKILKYSANLNGPGNANQIIMGDETFPSYVTLAVALENKINNVIIRPDQYGRAKAFSERTIMRHLTGQLKPMAVYVNGTEADPDVISYINPADVHSVEVLTSAAYYAIYGSDATAGALIITLKNGSEIPDTNEPAPGLLAYRFKGFYKAREFYSPKYSAKNPVSQADNRKTIFWMPNIFSDATGKANFNFFNAGSKGDYRLIVEGIAADGKYGRQVLKYKVDLAQ